MWIDKQWLPFLIWIINEFQLCLPFIHNHFTDIDLHHIFGTSNKHEVPKYTVSYVGHLEELESVLARKLYRVQHGSDLYEFHLEPSQLLTDGFHMVTHSGDKNETRLDTYETSGCTYTGHAVSHNDTFISLTGCDGRKRAMIMNQNSEFIFVHPIPHKYYHLYPVSEDGLHPHVIHKRETFEPLKTKIEEVSKDGVCLFDKKDDPFPTNVTEDRLRHNADRLAVVKGPLTVELGVFVDDAMWQHFSSIYGSKADSELLSFILAAVNNIHLLYSHRSLDPKVNMAIVRYEVFKTAPDPLNRRNHKSGDVDLLLESFCDYQDKINPSQDTNKLHWDHALLFSGYDLYRGKLKSVAGYAPVKGMCSGDRSCTINEGLDFGAVFVVTHEMGHSLGMYHDGDNGCDTGCCIMSPSVGAGKTRWSTCSVDEFNNFINKLGGSLNSPNCLLDLPTTKTLDTSQGGTLPGQKYTVDQQCRIFHGECWKHELRDGQTLEDICGMLWCGEGEGIIRTTHPALEGTFCGDKRWCIEGVCKATSTTFAPVNGGWSEWNDTPKSACGKGCSECELNNQLRIRRSLRLCEDPAPNNGGQECSGSNVRGIVCNDVKCDGPSPDRYASNICNKLKTDPNVPDLLLDGRGFQYPESPCRVWCHMSSSNFIRAVANFPDGTPCGSDKYCVKGECQALGCDKKAIVKNSPSDCPRSTANVIAGGNRASSIFNKPSWGEWSGWSVCTQPCGVGVKSRSRNCPAKDLCGDQSSQSEQCNTAPCAKDKGANQGDWAAWGTWTNCPQTCGGGNENRQRTCLKSPCDGLPFEYRDCKNDPCPVVNKDSWSGWSGWSTCSKQCGGGVQNRQRSCTSSICLGRSFESDSCNNQPCQQSLTRVSSGSLSGWASWSVCSVTCGNGVSSRTRSCQPPSANCNGNTLETKSCSRGGCGQPDSSGWSDWTDWTTCTRTCGRGAQFKRRFCQGNVLCTGRSIDFQPCQTRICPGDFGAVIKSTDSGDNWKPWGDWLPCSHSCGGGLQRRIRVCPNQQLCTGQSYEPRTCNAADCPVSATESHWDEWQSWSVCSCSRQSQRRFRQCRKVAPNQNCSIGSYWDEQKCKPTATC